jgi:hypothetical protein
MMTAGVTPVQAAKRFRRVDPAAVGRKVLAGLERGRQIAIANKQGQSTQRASLILTLAAGDIVAGRPTRGRAGRITRQLSRAGQLLSESQVRRILRRLSCVLDSQEQNARHVTGDLHHAQ